MKGYKGFNEDWTCRGYQYKMGETHTIEGEVEVCDNGLHACQTPLAVLAYYPPTSKFALVQSGSLTISAGDKFASNSLELIHELTLHELCVLGTEAIVSNVSFEGTPATNTGYRSAATNTGYQSAATNTGDQSAATNTGYRSAATNTGDQSAATNTGDQSAATNTGYQSAATNTGYQSAATNTGDQSAATNTGYQSAAEVSGAHSVALASGYSSKAKACLGSAIVLVYRNSDFELVHIKAGIAGIDVEPDTWYTLSEQGEFEKC